MRGAKSQELITTFHKRPTFKYAGVRTSLWVSFGWSVFGIQATE